MSAYHRSSLSCESQHAIRTSHCFYRDALRLVRKYNGAKRNYVVLQDMAYKGLRLDLTSRTSFAFSTYAGSYS